MEYKVIDLKEKTIAGISVRTNNFSEDAGMVIGNQWKNFYENGIYESIKNKTTGYSLGVYTEYAGNEKDDYTMMTACEIKNTDDIPENVEIYKIPAGRYAVFSIKGDVQKVVIEFWQKLWEMKLDRNFVCDFEEYREGTPEDCEINIYIGIK